MRSRWIAFALIAALALAVPAASQATLVFTRKPLDPTIWVAKDDGSGAKPLTKGRGPRVTPDGKQVLFERETRAHGYRPELLIEAANGAGGARTLLVNWAEPFAFAFEPDSSGVAVVAGSGNKEQLETIDLATGEQHAVARGFFSGVSFSPNGEELVYAKSAADAFPPRSDVYRASLTSGKITALTHDHNSIAPLWGPKGQIAFVKLLHAKQRKYAPENQIFLMSESGGQVKQLTHTRVDPLLSGLIPLDWSADGTRLLAEFGGQDTSYAVTVDPKTGRERSLTKERELGFVGAALSADGRSVLGAVGEYEGNIPGRKVMSVPYGGGKAKVLAKGATEPDWSR